MLQLIRAAGRLPRRPRSSTPTARSPTATTSRPASRDPSPTALESEASAIRGLLDAYLATSDTNYRIAAERVYADLDARFWMSDVRAFRTTAGVERHA